jgi:hypothetical protein
MFNGIKAVLLTASILFASAGSTEAASLGISFLGDGEEGTDAWRLAPTDEAGVVLQTHWNNVNTTPTSNAGVADSLVDEAGNFTSVLLEYTANDAWNSDGFSDTPNEKLMKGILKNYPGSSMVLTVTNLAPAFYDVYLYGNVNGGPMDMDVTVNAVTNYWTAPAAFQEAVGFLDASSLDPDARGEGNYIKVIGVTPVSGGITVTATHVDGADGAAVAGLQVFSSVAFSTGVQITLTARLEADNIVLSWDAPTYQLQYRTDLNEGDWTDEPTEPEISGNQATVRLPATGAARFFRLRNG